MKLDYEIVYARRKTICITVERDRRICVRVPEEASDRAVAAAIESKRFWIWQKLRDPDKYPDPVFHKEFVAGETFLLLGEQCGLTLTSGKGGAVRLLGSQFELALGDRHKGGTLFRSWYLSRAKKTLPHQIASLASAMGIAYSRVAVRDLRHSWGSCTPRGTLSFNWRIIQAPMIVINYIIVHELAHVMHSNHSPAFWNTVAVHVPNWEKARSWLKQHGGQLEW